MFACVCVCPQSKVLTEGVALHTQVRPDSMKGLHERIVEQLQKYNARYGNRTTGSSGEYEKYEVGPYHPLEAQQQTPPSRRTSTNQRRESQKRIPSGGDSEHSHSHFYFLVLPHTHSLTHPLSLSLSGSERSYTTTTRPPSMHERMYDTVHVSPLRERASTEMQREPPRFEGSLEIGNVS